MSRWLFTAIFIMTSLLYSLPIVALESYSESHSLHSLEAGRHTKKCQKKKLKAAQKALCRAIKRGEFTIEILLTLEDLVDQIRLDQEQMAQEGFIGAGGGLINTNNAFFFTDTPQNAIPGAKQVIRFNTQVSANGISIVTPSTFLVSRAGSYLVDWSFNYTPVDPQAGQTVRALLVKTDSLGPSEFFEPIDKIMGTAPITFAQTLILTPPLREGEGIRLQIEPPAGFNGVINHATISIIEIL